MRLGSKIFLTSALVIVVLAGVGFLSLRALGRLVSVNREIATRTVPALRLTASAREAIAPLVRLEARAIVLGDARYATAWTERAARVADNLDRLAEYAVSEREAFYLREASAAFEGYRRVVAEEQALLQRGERARALRLTDADARVLTEDVQENLDGLMAATHTRVLAAQAEAARLESRTWTAVLIALTAAVCLALLGTAVVAQRMTRSLALLSSATAEVAAGAFREPIVVESRDEIGALARSFNSMASQLREMDDMKRDFFETVSHELRSPLTSIRGAADLLRDGVPGPLTEKQERLMDIIGQSSERLLRLVNQILETSRLRAGLVELDRKALNLAWLLGRGVREVHLPSRAKERAAASPCSCRAHEDTGRRPAPRPSRRWLRLPASVAVVVWAGARESRPPRRAGRLRGGRGRLRRVPRETRRGRAGPNEPEHGGVDSRAPARDRAAPRGPRQARGGPGAAEGARPPHRAPRREEVNRAVSGHPDHRRGPRQPPPSLPQDRLRGRSPRSKGDQSHGHPPIGPAPLTPLQ